MVAYQTLFGALLLALSLFIEGCDSIILRRIGVPTYAVKGREAVLECDFDLQGQTLYSVKWYKNGMEFYRYIPGNRNPMTYYVRTGVVVDKRRSNDRQVTLTRLSMKSTGRYRCEVSTEAPSFDTVSSFGDMIIVVLPESGPKITGGKDRYNVGDLVNVNCTSSNSKPAADLAWFINGQPADEAFLLRYPIQNSTERSGVHERVHTSTLGLRFYVDRSHFFTGDGSSSSTFNPESSVGLLHTGMKLKCTASINTVYWQSNEKSAESSKQRRMALATYSETAGGFLQNYAPDNVDGGAWPYHEFSSSAGQPQIFIMIYSLPFIIHQLLSSII